MPKNWRRPLSINLALMYSSSSHENYLDNPNHFVNTACKLRTCRQDGWTMDRKPGHQIYLKQRDIGRKVSLLCQCRCLLLLLVLLNVSNTLQSEVESRGRPYWISEVKIWQRPRWMLVTISQERTEQFTMDKSYHNIDHIRIHHIYSMPKQNAPFRP